MSFSYYNCCVDWDPDEVHSPGGLVDMIDQARQITRRTFLKHVGTRDLRSLEESLGYESHPAKGLTMAGDFHVGYFKSKLFGRPVYFFRWSAIEYVFME